jgi:hypothetical protein
LVPLNIASPAYFFGAGAAIPPKSQSPELQVFAAVVKVKSSQVKPFVGLTVKPAFGYDAGLGKLDAGRSTARFLDFGVA